MNVLQLIESMDFMMSVSFWRNLNDWVGVWSIENKKEINNYFKFEWNIGNLGSVRWKNAYEREKDWKF